MSRYQANGQSVLYRHLDQAYSVFGAINVVKRCADEGNGRADWHEGWNNDLDLTLPITNCTNSQNIGKSELSRALFCTGSGAP